MKTYIVDIDNTICMTLGNDYNNSTPFYDRIEKINKLHDDGHRIIYWTARGSGSGIDWADKTHSQLIEWGCKHDEIRLGKPSYDIWIDDKAINALDFFI